jgi:hypothetical protein
MAKRIFDASNLTYTASAYGGALTSSTAMQMVGGSTTQLIDILEILISGMATASTVAAMQLTRTMTTVASGFTALASPNSDGPAHPATAVLAAAPTTFVAATANSIPSSTTTDAKLNFGINLFGGIIRWNAAPTQQFSVLGSAVGLGNCCLFNSSTSGGSSGLANAHWVYEPY